MSQSYDIGVDARMLHHSGIGTYLRGTLAGLKKHIPESKRSLCLFGNDGLKDSGDYPHQSGFNAPIYSVQEQLVYPRYLSQCRLWHAPHYNVPLLKGKTKLVVTIHDMIHWIFRREWLTPLQRIYAEVMMRKAVRLADHILTVSEHTKNDLIQYLDAPAEKISVTYEGVDESFLPVSDETVLKQVRSKYGLPERYFLYVGLLKPHKNVLWLMRIFDKIASEPWLNAALVVVGKKDKSYAGAYTDLNNPEQFKKVIHIPYAEKGDLCALYSGAKALTHPSIYEGFGLTLLEAMACQTPVIASRVASIPEVVGDAAYLLSPGDEEGMIKAIRTILSDPELSETLRRKGVEQVKKFNWQKTGKRTMKVYEQVLMS